MSTLIVYPADLPCPQIAPIQSAERRVLSAEGLFETRAVQRDRLAYQQVAFTLTAAQALSWDAWWTDTLLRGGAWFSAYWPLPQGWRDGIRRFLEPPRWDFIGKPSPEGMWRVSVPCEVKGASLPPVRTTAPIFLLHFDNNLTDVSGHLFEADTIITDAAPNSFTYTTDALFGSHSGRFPGTNNHIRSEPWPGGLQLASFDWQLEGWIRPRDVGGEVGGPIINTGSLQTGGNIIGPDPENGQIRLHITDTGVYEIEYSDALGSDDLIVVGSPAAVPEDVWTHFALVSDATSLRLYSAGILVAETPGVRPFAGAYDSLQRFFIGCAYTGGIPPLETYVDRYHGDVDEFRLTTEVTYTGTTITVPTAAFPARS